jgi:hypothetical protein
MEILELQTESIVSGLKEDSISRSWLLAIKQ